MADDETTTLRKLYKQASSINGLPRFSFVGPFGQRVSFASQQRRALNTVWAVHADLPTTRAPVVAVLGGGIAGLTTAAALLVKGCRVTLFEREVRMASAQRGASHRYVHPTVNFWPEKELNSTTEFPFLEWHEDSCHKVAEAIVEEWDRTFADELTESLMETNVTGIASVGDKAEVRYDEIVGGNRSRSSSKTFDHVFVTTGFGVENRLFNTDRTYWEPDSFEYRRDKGNAKFVIGGTGDGGLIEALRVLQRDFDSGRLCLRIIRMIDAANLTKEVAAIEEKVQAGASDDDAAAIEYWAEYQRLADGLTVKLDKQLGSRFEGLSVTLVGLLPHPFQRNVAPIHKLMIAHAIRQGALNYVQGELKIGADGVSSVIATSTGEQAVDAEANVLVRIGPKHPLDGLISADDVARLRLQQKQMADLLSPVPIDHSFFSRADMAPTRGSAEHAMSRQRLAAKFMSEMYNSGIKVEHDGGVPFFSTVDPCKSNPPNSLFGVPLRPGNILVARPL